MKRLTLLFGILGSFGFNQAGILENFTDKLQGTRAYWPYQHFLGKIDQLHGFLTIKLGLDKYNYYQKTIAGYPVKKVGWRIYTNIFGTTKAKVTATVDSKLFGEQKIEYYLIPGQVCRYNNNKVTIDEGYMVTKDTPLSKLFFLSPHFYFPLDEKIHWIMGINKSEKIYTEIKDLLNEKEKDIEQKMVDLYNSPLNVKTPTGYHYLNEGQTYQIK